MQREYQRLDFSGEQGHGRGADGRLRRSAPRRSPSVGVGLLGWAFQWSLENNRHSDGSSSTLSCREL